MNTIEDVKRRIKGKKNIVSDRESNSKFHVFIFKFFTVVIFFAFGTLIVNKDVNIKKIIFDKVYKSNFSFASFKNIYNTYIGNILPFDRIFKNRHVFNEKLEYNTISKYNKGAKLTLSKGYAIPSLKGGIIIYNGEKEDFGKTIIVQQSDGIDVWYGNLSNTSLNLYDYIDDNAIIGEANNDTLYLKFQKDGVEIDYKEILR